MGITSAFIVEDRTSTADAKATFDFCRNLIGASRRHRWSEGPSSIMPGAHTYAMEPNQGLPVWLQLFHREDGLPVVDNEDPPPRRTLEIWIDQGAPKTHDRVLKEVGAWLTSQGWRWQWRNDHQDATYDWHRVRT